MIYYGVKPFYYVVNMAVKLGIALCFIVLITAWDVYASVNCKQTGAGRFPEPTDTKCKNYTLCVYNSNNNSYLSYDYTCPTTSVFNPSISKCTAPENYECKVTTAICTSDGFVPNPSSTDCTAFIECVEIDGNFVETLYSCPDNTFFNPSTSLCEYNYICRKYFKCSAAGRFADTSDSTCRSYYFCVLASDGTYGQYQYTCPNESVFDPIYKVCTTLYKCNS